MKSDNPCSAISFQTTLGRVDAGVCDPKSSQALVEFVGNNKNFQYSDGAKPLIWLGFDFRKIHHTPSFATQKRLYPTMHYLIKNGIG